MMSHSSKESRGLVDSAEGREEARRPWCLPRLNLYCFVAGTFLVVVLGQDRTDSAFIAEEISEFKLGMCRQICR